MDAAYYFNFVITLTMSQPGNSLNHRTI